MKSQIQKTLIAALTAFLTSSVFAADVATVTTESGIYAGAVSDHQSSVTACKGIAFASPPVRDLRWRPPVPAIPFAGDRQENRELGTSRHIPGEQRDRLGDRVVAVELRVVKIHRMSPSTGNLLKA